MLTCPYSETPNNSGKHAAELLKKDLAKHEAENEAIKVKMAEQVSKGA